MFCDTVLTADRVLICQYSDNEWESDLYLFAYSTMLQYRLLGKDTYEFGTAAFPRGTLARLHYLITKLCTGVYVKTQRRVTLIRSSGTAKVKLEITSRLQQTGWLPERIPSTWFWKEKKIDTKLSVLNIILLSWDTKKM